MPVEKFAASQVIGVRLHVSGLWFRKSRFLCGKQLHLQLLDDRVCNFVLNGENISQIAIKTLRPKMAVVPAVDELTGYSHARACLADTAFHHETCSEFPT